MSDRDCYRTHQISWEARGQYATWSFYDDGCVNLDADSIQCMWWFRVEQTLEEIKAEVGPDWSLVTARAQPVSIPKALAEAFGG